MRRKNQAPRPETAGRERALLKKIRSLELALAHESHQASFPELNPMPVCEVGPDGRVTYLNAATRRAFPDLAGRGTGHPWIAGIRDGLLPQFASGKKKLLHHEIVINGRWYDQALHYVKLDQRIRIYGQDITERKRAERDAAERLEELSAANQELLASEEELQTANEDLRSANEQLLKISRELRESEARFKALYEGLPYSTVVFQKKSDEYVIAEYNQAAQAFAGGQMQKYVGKTAREIYGARPEILEMIERAGRTKAVQTLQETYRTLSTGKDISLDLTLAHVPPDLIVMHSLDITERKRAEQAVRQAQARTAAILNGIADTFYALDGDWRFTIVNPAAERAPFGRPAAELLGKAIWDIFPNLVGTPIHRHYLDAAEKKTLEHYEAQSPLNGRWYDVFMQGWEEGVDVYMRDITDRKRAEQAVLEEKDRLASLLASIADEVWFADTNKTFTLANPSAAREFRLDSPDRTDVLKLAGSLEVLRADGSPRPVDEAPPLRALNGEVITGEEEIIRTPGSGELRYRQVSSAPVRDAKGTIIGSVSVVRDIAERKRKEEELRTLNRTLKALGNSGQAMMRAASEAKYLDDVCRIIIKDCGYSMVWIGYAEQDAGKSVRPVAYAGFEQGYLETLRITWADSERGRGPTGTAIRTGKPSMCRNMLTDPAFAPWRDEARRRGYASSVVLPLLAGDTAFGAISIYSRNPDSFAPAEVELLSELAGDLAYGIGTIRQREARIKAEQALEQSEARFRAIASTAPIGIGVVGLPEGTFLYVNGAYEKAFGYSSDELIGQPTPQIYADPADRDRLVQALREKGGVTDYEVRMKRKDGTEFWGVSSVQPIAYGGRPALLGAFVDITERKRIEEELRRSHVELEQRVEERTAQLLKAHRDLEMSRRLSDIGTLASTVAHELRNPLAAIRMAAYNIKRKAQLPALDKHLDTIDKKVSDSDQIINNLLFYSRIRTVEHQAVDICALLDESLETVAGRHRDKQADYVKAYAGLAGLAIEADPLQLKEVIENLVDNALDAVADGGRIEVRGDARDPGRYVISINDNGAGIDPELLPKVFEPFFSTKSKGTGLGLAVCRQIVELHDGQIAIDSAKGRGTTVTITLPRARGG